MKKSQLLLIGLVLLPFALDAHADTTSAAGVAAPATSTSATSPPAGTTTGILDTYPGLQKFVAKEHESHIYFGFGVSPFTIVNSKIGFGASLFQWHYINDTLDFEILNASFSNVFGQTYGNEQMFLLRTAPKLKLFKNVSVGPLAGVEFVHFPSVTDELTKQVNGQQLYSKPFDFSTLGAVYGITASETIPLGSGDRTDLLKINELVFREMYNSNGTNNGWTYYYIQEPLNTDKSPIAASTVFMVEISFLY
jgi:hypothetical protein